MSVKIIKPWSLVVNNFKLIDNSILLFLPLTLLSTSALKTQASEELTDFEGNQQISQVNNVWQLKSKENLNNDEATNQMTQITNVQQLRDVAPTDWAYEALRSLVDRYGCISGFPNQTYRGDRPLSRYEFAAGLNSCLNQIERLIAANESVSQLDLETVQRLSQEFAAELTTIGGRLDSLESQVAILEDNQFSTTTKFSGSLFANFTGATASDDVEAETVSLDAPFSLRRAGRDSENKPITSTITEDPEITFSYYTDTVGESNLS